MAYLLDSNVPLRVVNRRDPYYAVARHALAMLIQTDEILVIAPQSMAEIWNVLTRPASARGGYGLNITDAERIILRLELRVQVWPEPPGMYPLWRRLIASAGVQGVQAHDARLAAYCDALGITHLLSFNSTDFTRFVPFLPGLHIVHPAAL
jgi:predicted nucleic acid-binding protein